MPSLFNMRGGARNLTQTGQPTGLGGVPVGQPGSNVAAMYQKRRMAELERAAPQSAFSQTLSTVAAAPAQSALARPGVNMGGSAGNLPHATTPMFQPSFQQPTGPIARYLAKMPRASVAQPQAVVGAPAPTLSAQGQTVQPQMTAPQSVVARTPAYQSPGERAMGNGVAPLAVQRVTSGGLELAPESGATGEWKDDTGEAFVRQKDGTWAPGIPSSGYYRAQDGKAYIDGELVFDPSAPDPYAEDQSVSQAQSLLNQAGDAARAAHEGAYTLADRNQIMDALAKAGEQAMRGGTSGYGLAEQGQVLQAEQVAKANADNLLASTLGNLSGQQSDLDQRDYERAAAMFNMDSTEGRKAYALSQNMGQWTDRARQLAQGGVTADESEEYSDLIHKIADAQGQIDELTAAQSGTTKDKTADGTYNPKLFGGDIANTNSVDVTDNPVKAAELATNLANDLKMYFFYLRTRFGRNLGDKDSVYEVRGMINDLIDRAQQGDPVATKALKDVGLRSVINGNYDDDDSLAEAIDGAMDAAFDQMTEYGPFQELELSKAWSDGVPPLPDMGGYVYLKTGQAPDPNAV